jgi:septum formation protein
MSEYKLVLASNSPRRRELLTNSGLSFTSDPADVDESVLPGEEPGVYAVRLALAKAVKTSYRHKDGVVLGADTIVVVDGEILGKPASPDDARRMIASIAGREHEVLTGVALVDIAPGRRVTGLESTRVRLRGLSAREMDAYVATGEPLDKAGGYGIQGRAAFFVTGITGCYFNVAGLPLARLAALAVELGRPLPYLEFG